MDNDRVLVYCLDQVAGDHQGKDTNYEPVHMCQLY